VKTRIWGLLLLVLVAVPASRAEEEARRRPVAFQAGEKEKYVFKMGGKAIGEQTAECQSVVPAREKGMGTWKFAINLNIEGQGKITMDGSVTLDTTVKPTAFTLSATFGGMTTRVTCAFSPGKAKAVISAGGNDLKQEAAWSETDYLLVNNLVTSFSFITRSLGIEPGQKKTIRAFSPNVMQTLEVTFTALPKTEKIEIGGKTVECVVCDVAPIQSRVHLERESGALLRLTSEGQNLLIERTDWPPQKPKSPPPPT
jgi:hypothetical protein